MSRPVTIELRSEQPEDAAAIREIQWLAFGRPAEADIVDSIRAADAAVLSMVAVELEGARSIGDAATSLIGHVLYTRVTVAGEHGEEVSLLGLAPVAVLPSHQGRGVGTMLIEASLEQLRAEGCLAVVVVGDPRYYPRFGFLPGGRWGLRWEADAPDDVFMVVELVPGALAGIHGTVRFRPEFDGA
jgi:putative acetyltransferase